MPRRGRRARRSFRDWAARGLLLTGVAVLGWISVSRAAGYSLHNVDPARAHALAPGDGRISALLAQRLLADPEATADGRRRADRLAREALRREPLAVVAVSTLGINAQVRGDTAGARRIFAYSEELSRRDLQTRLWAIEDSVGRGKIGDALRHYDIALRTSRSAPALLFPILVSAIAEPSVRSALVRTLAAGPAWAPDFVAYAASNSPDPGATASLFASLSRSGVPVAGDVGATLIRTLVSHEQFEPAWRFYAQRHPGTDRRRSRDPNFVSDPALASPFDWVAVNEGGTNTSIQRTSGGGVVDFSAPASVGGDLLRQLQMLSPGPYRLSGTSAEISQPAQSLPYWTLTCLNGRELGRVFVPNSDREKGAFAGQFTVPADCPVQTLTLVAQPSDAIGGLSGQIMRVQLAPAFVGAQR